MSIHKTPGKVRLSVKVVAGTARIEARETTETQVQVEPRNDAARELMDDVREEMREDNGSYDVIVELPEGKKWGFFGREPEFDVTVTLPTQADVKVDAVSADVRCKGSLGATDVKSVSGDIEVESISGTATIRSVSGDLELGTVDGSLAFKSVSGDVVVRRAMADVRGTSVSGDIELGTVVQGEVTIKSTSGDIGIGVAPGADVWMDVSSLSGDTTSELESGGEAPEMLSLEIRASSLSGDITLRRAAPVTA